MIREEVEEHRDARPKSLCRFELEAADLGGLTVLLAVEAQRPDAPFGQGEAEGGDGEIAVEAAAGRQGSDGGGEDRS